MLKNVQVKFKMYTFIVLLNHIDTPLSHEYLI